MIVCLLVESQQLRSEMDVALRPAGMNLVSSSSLEHAQERLGQRIPDLFLVSQSRSWYGGEHIVTRLKEHRNYGQVPVVVIGGEDEVLEILALTLGADEYIAWPISSDLLLARLDAVRRRRTSQRDAEYLSCGPLQIDNAGCTVLQEGRVLSLSRTEFKVLKLIMTNGEKVTLRAELAGAVLGPGADPRDRRLDVHVSTLRRKLGSHRKWLNTVRGVGFAWREPRERQ